MIVRPDLINKTFNIGVFARFKYSQLKYLHPFFESNCYYSYAYYVTADEPRHLDHQYISGYVAPGITLNLVKWGLNFDIFYKFSPHQMIDGRKSVVSYRISFNF